MTVISKKSKWVELTCVDSSPLSLSSVVSPLAQPSASLSLLPGTPDAADKKRTEEEEAWCREERGRMRTSAGSEV